MSGGARWITLSQGVSWLAFGQLLKAKELTGHLAAPQYSTEKLQALQEGVKKVASMARDGALTLQGRFVDGADETGETALTEYIPANKLGDYQAFDITTDGLRYGTGLRWLPNTLVEDGEELWHTLQPMLRQEHFTHVLLDYSQLEKQRPPRNRPPLAQSELKKWWKGLSDDEKQLREATHRSMLDVTFPDHAVARKRLRDLRGPRKRGREKKSP
jgi:hypothetical protein